MEPSRFWVREDRYYTHTYKHWKQETGEAVIETTPMEPAIKGTNRLPKQIRAVGCLAYARRKFDETLTAVPKEQQPSFKPAEALRYFSKLAQLEESFAELTAEERYTKRLEQEKPVLEAWLV